jgi:hypothetical protein
MWMLLESEEALFRFCAQHCALRGVPAGIGFEQVSMKE